MIGGGGEKANKNAWNILIFSDVKLFPLSLILTDEVLFAFAIYVGLSVGEVSWFQYLVYHACKY